MRILSVHNRYQIRGGEDECYEAEVNLLRQMGDEVDVYEEDNTRVATLNNLTKVTRTVWSKQAYQAVRDSLKKRPCDVVHVQNFFPLISPSVYYAAKAEGVPVIQTLHNYRLLCPNALFFRDGKVCEDCLGKAIPYPGVLHGCYRDSKVASGGVATMLSVHRILNTWVKKVDLYIVLTEFARQKFIAGGFPAEKIVIKPNFISDSAIGEGRGGYALFVGRLSKEKGIDTLLAAWEHLGKQIPLKIIGDGPLADEVLQATKKLPHVEWLGRKPIEEVYALMGEATFVVFPSKWYETFGRVAIEAFAKGTPVVAANIGAIAELVDPGRTGLLFRPADAKDLVTQVEYLLANPSQLVEMRREVRAEFEAKYTAKKNYQQLIDIYTKARNMTTY
jgi:glycosyltransferase involved in cell wall biosynthesis